MRRWLFLVPLLLCAPAAHAQTPTYAKNGHSCAFAGPFALTGMVCPLPNPSGVNNAIVCALFYSTNQNGTPGCTDDKSNTYTKAGTSTDAGNKAAVDIWVACGAAAGTSQIKPVLTGNTAASVTTGAIVAEFYNVPTSSCMDASTFNGNFGSGASVTTASTTPSATGEMLLMFAFSDSSNATGWTVGSQANITWLLRSAQSDTGGKLAGQAFQYGIYNSTAAITPTMSTSGGAGWVTASVFLKPASAGTPPPSTGVRVLFDEAPDLNSLVAGTVAIRFPHYGNTPVVNYLSGGATFTTTGTPSDSCSEVWVQPTNSPFNGHVWMYTKNAGTCDGTVSWVFAGTNNSASMHMYDIDGADSTNPVCDSNGNSRIETATGTQGNVANQPLPDAPDITPCRANGTVLAELGVGTGGAIGVSNAGAVFESCVPRPFEPITDCDENNGWAQLNNATTSPISWTWTFENAPNGINGWDASAMAIQPPAGAAAPDFSLTPGAPTSNTVTAGQTAMYTIAITDLNGFTGAVGLTCSVASPVQTSFPPTCSLSPMSITPGGQQTTALSVSTTSRAFAPPLPFTRGWPRFIPVVTLVALFVLMAAFTYFALRRRQYWFVGSIFAVTVLLLVLAAAGCGGAGTSGGGTRGTPPGSYTVTVTGASGSLTHTTSVTLVVN
jgi:hypothetical protein